MERLSIVIPNYNYGRFIGSAIDSALAVNWPDVEVIVVDNGSTDESQSVIRSFGPQITAFFQENAGPRGACNVGFAASTGDVVIFLDSDDVLEPSIAREVAAVWRPGVSKVQVQMQRINAEGRAVGGTFPKYRHVPTAEEIRHWMSTTSAYPTPPGSGNVYARSFLEQLFPLDDSCGDAPDSACLAAAPVLGDVLTVAKPLVQYRLHGNNRSSVAVDPARLPAQIRLALQRHRFALALSSEPPPQNPIAPLFRSRHLLQMRVAERRVSDGEPPLPTDSRVRMMRDSFVNLMTPGPESIWLRLAISGWCVTTLVAPRPVAHWLIQRNFA